MIPTRIQRKRTRGWTVPSDALGNLPIYVGRPTIFGNPFDSPRLTARRKVELFRAYLTGEDGNPTTPEREELLRKLPTLRGKTLMCWCPVLDEQGKPVPCHADVLLEIANAEPL